MTDLEALKARQEPLFSCQDEFCREECSFYANMLRQWNDGPICEDCYDAERWSADEDMDDLPFDKLPPFVPAYQATIERLEAENAKLRAELEAINSLAAQCEAENAKLREALRAAYDDTPGWCDLARAALKG